MLFFSTFACLSFIYTQIQCTERKTTVGIIDLTFIVFFYNYFFLCLSRSALCNLCDSLILERVLPLLLILVFFYASCAFMKSLWRTSSKFAFYPNINSLPRSPHYLVRRSSSFTLYTTSTLDAVGFIEFCVLIVGWSKNVKY